MTWPPAPQRLGAGLDVVGVGEPMLLLQAVPPETLASADRLAVDVAGAELNVCVAVARLGGAAALLTRLGEDAPGRRVLGEVEARGVGTGLVRHDADRPTGLFLRETPPDGSRRVTYYRTGSAASAMTAADAERLWAGPVPRAVVLSGLTAALGPGPRELMAAIAARAAGHGTAVVVDVNLRPGMGAVDESVATVRELLPRTDLLVLGDDESAPLLGTTDPGEVLAAARAAGVGETVLKGGERGCWYDDDGPRHLPSAATQVVDPVGAGDAFLGGYLAARLAGARPRGAAALGNDLAAAVIGAPGDSTGLPPAAEAYRMLDAAVTA